MNKSFRLQPLIELARQELDNAVKKLGELNRQKQEISSKLNMLMQYRQEYQIRFEEAVKRGLNQTEWQNFQHFFYKLDEAIDLQKRTQQEFTLVVEAGQIEYQERQKKLKSFETLAERHFAAEAAKAARKEQKEMDDFSNKSYLRKLRNED